MKDIVGRIELTHFVNSEGKHSAQLEGKEVTLFLFLEGIFMLAEQAVKNSDLTLEDICTLLQNNSWETNSKGTLN